MNEVFWGQKGFEEFIKDRKKRDAKALGAQLTAEANRLDPTRPVIENSGISNDLASGDTHDYRGSLSGGKSTYFDIYAGPNDMFGSPPNLVTEFGVDAPPDISIIHAISEAASVAVNRSHDKVLERDILQAEKTYSEDETSGSLFRTAGCMRNSPRLICTLAM